MKKKLIKVTASTLLLSLTYQLLFPLRALALTTGPSQPEVQSFEPVGTTEMVNMFTGDFNYNIPLMDVEGYPINIAYHSGVGIEQEASWCGLGWNINPGEINRTVRGLPDDFNGDRIEKEIHIKEERNLRTGIAASLGFEIAGWDNAQISFTLGLYTQFNNYKGTSVGANVGVGLSTPVGSAGIDMGIGSQTGAEIDANATFRLSQVAGHQLGPVSSGFSVSGGTGFNSRQGLRDLSFSVNSGTTLPGAGALAYNSTIPIGVQNYVPVITNETVLRSFQYQVKTGGEIYYLYPNLVMNAAISLMDYKVDGSRNGYGYLYSENAPDDAIMDFSRDKDGIYNRTLSNLPPSSMTYDIYSVNGQGTGGSFRPFRSDIGTVFDPHTKSTTEGNDGLVEFGAGNLFEIGNDVSLYDVTDESGPWKKLAFNGKQPGSLYEKAYFKSAGELTYNNQSAAAQLYNTGVQYVGADMNTLVGKGGAAGVLPAKYGNANIWWNNSIVDRTSRADLLSYFTAEEASQPEVGQSTTLKTFKDSASGNSRFYDPAEQSTPRYGTTNYVTKKDHISEFTQTTADGRRYIYGLPAINHMSREVSFSVDENNANLSTGLVSYTPGNEDSRNNNKGKENLYVSSTTPAHAYSYLLTSVLSTDYVDIMGDGPTDDDLGSYTKFNYKLYNDDYRWRTPYQDGQAQYNPGFYSDGADGKGSYLTGSRQQWQLRSVETKNYIAEFYVSERHDGKGATGAVLPAASNMQTPSGVNLKTATNANTSYKLDSIKLYNKHDRYINENNAVAIKTVIFKYDYSLCPGIPNTSVPGEGKLTLKNIYIKYGNSEKNLLSPYTFTYQNPALGYDFAAKDRWGNYKSNNPALTNYEFPYTRQDATADSAAAWNLTQIKLPSGGKINVTYEADDYSYVQDKRAMQMYMLVGTGSSPNLEYKNKLYEDADNINDYVYFQRNKTKEIPGLSMRDNYLEGDSMLYYNFNLDITGNGKYEYIKSYAKVEAIDSCPNNSNYGYLKLHREPAGNMKLHPATVYGINTARYYLQHILYPGFKDDEGNTKIVAGLLAAATEMKNIFQNPYKQFLKDNKAKRVRLEKSWLRLQTAGLTKKGGGIRVKRLTLDDQWNTLSGSGTNTSYGKDYDYTVTDARYGKISSGVASYEPMIGGDENACRRPGPAYTADGGRGLPNIDFYQEEPFGESFFPGPQVGYSSVRITSIHVNEGRSSQAEDEYLYYTAKDFPIVVDYTTKEAPGQTRTRGLRKMVKDEHVLQGYTLIFNDMHGKPKAINNYVLHTDGTNTKKEKITGVTWHYRTDSRGRLDNNVNALVRLRGSRSNYAVQNTTLGQEIDYTVDSRSRYSRTYSRTVSINLNVSMIGVWPIPVPSMFFPDHEDVQSFQAMVSTKIIQQYGIVGSVENFDHGATTVSNNLVYDGETGGVLLSSVNNEFNDNTYSLSYPAHLAYLGMGPAYTNDGYEEVADSIVWKNYEAILYTQHKDRFYAGDELMITYKFLSGNDSLQRTRKVWITDIGTTEYQDQAQFINACRIKIEPRFAYQTGTPALPWPDWTDNNSKLTNILVRVVRSGRRNMLDKTVQQTVLTKNPYAGNVNDLFGNTTANGNAFNSLLSVGGTTYTDIAQPFAHDNGSDDNGYPSAADTIRQPGNGSAYYVLSNSYVNGRSGNFRPLGQYVSYANRNYDKGHIRYDGTFPINNPLWTLSNDNTNYCYGTNNVLLLNAISGEYWKQVSQVVRYDVFGNALEEKDAIGNYSSAQYGYRRSLPQAVAVNVRQSNFIFEGFEDYRMLVPEYTKQFQFNSEYLSTPFAKYFKDLAQTSGTYSNTNTIPGNPSATNVIRRNGQNFNLLSMNGTGGNMNITNETNHTGYYCLKSINGQSIPLRVSYPNDADYVHGGWDARTNRKFSLKRGRKYQFNCWVKPFSGTTGLNQFNIVVNGTNINMQQLTSSIDGWYLLGGTIDLSAYSDSDDPLPALAVSLSIPANVYVDDVRWIPVDASMKSFVYDPVSFKLLAQLDENHMATFYEYDQEGQLVRVKKETDQGVKTISESRRSNSKKP